VIGSAILILSGIGTLGCAVLAFCKKGFWLRLLLLMPSTLALSIALASYLHVLFPTSTFDLTDLGCSGNALKGLVCPDYGHWRIKLEMTRVNVLVFGGISYIFAIGPISAIASIVLAFEHFAKKNPTNKGRA
jgi:hypothetical protein